MRIPYIHMFHAYYSVLALLAIEKGIAIANLCFNNNIAITFSYSNWLWHADKIFFLFCTLDTAT